MDWLGVFFIVVAVGALLTALNEASKLIGGVTMVPLVISLALALVSVVSFMAFWKVEKVSSHPMVETVHLRQRSTWAPLLTTTLTMTGIFAVINGIVPAFVQAADPGFGIGATGHGLPERQNWRILCRCSNAASRSSPSC